MDGIIAVGLGADTTLLEHIASFKLPMVVVNRFFPTAEHIGCVRSDMTGWIEHEVAELKKLNCRNVLVLNKPENSDAGCEISHAVKTLAAENNSGDFKLDMITVREDLLQQMCEILQIEPFYDGFIINGSDGILLQQVAAQLDIPPGSFVISNFSVDSRYNSSGRVWCRCGYDIGTQGWNMLLNMLSGKCSGSEVLLPIIPAQRGIRRKSDIEYGFDL
jgi:hypothetical protein